MQINLVLIFQIRTGVTYINMKMEIAYTMFYINGFSSTLEFHAPLIKSFQPEKTAEKPWLTKELRKKSRKTDFLISGKRTHRSKRIPFSNIRKIWLIGVFEKPKTKFAIFFSMNYQQVKTMEFHQKKELQRKGVSRYRQTSRW